MIKKLLKRKYNYGQARDIEIKIDELVAKAKEFMAKDWRLVQICATKLEQMELSYSFGKEHDLMTFALYCLLLTSKSLRSQVFISRLLAMKTRFHDLFGINIKGNVIDYKGNFYTTAVKTPFKV